MEITGIVRRIDDLGSIVIPKEIRRKLLIEEGDPLEIIPARDGVLIKKYKQLETLEMMAEGVRIALEKQMNARVLITDNDHFLSQELRREKLPQTLRIDIMNGLVADLKQGFDIFQGTALESQYAVVFPIQSDVGSHGSIIVLREDRQMNNVEKRYVEALSTILGTLCSEKAV